MSRMGRNFFQITPSSVSSGNRKAQLTIFFSALNVQDSATQTLVQREESSSSFEISQGAMMHVCVFILKCNCNYPLVSRNQVKTAAKISFPIVILCFKSSFSQQSKTYHVLGRKKQVVVSKHFEGEETNHYLIPLLGSVLCLSSDHIWVNPENTGPASAHLSLYPNFTTQNLLTLASYMSNVYFRHLI